MNSTLLVHLPHLDPRLAVQARQDRLEVLLVQLRHHGPAGLTAISGSVGDGEPVLLALEEDGPGHQDGRLDPGVLVWS